ncbi:MAG: peptidase domain-containing ABC transporter [Betaproteobacteria bacterium]|nr:peptidase domain-containing ABC transporter [Betaproteobacteria bacterium]
MNPVLQLQNAECGLACLCMIANAHGQHWRLMDLRHKFPQTLKGANLKQLIDQSQVLGFNARPVRLELEELHQLATPCILHWDLNHFVVLQKIKGQQVTLLDPALGLRNISLAIASQHFTGVALELAPHAQFKTKAASKSFPLSQLTGNIRGLGKSAAQILALAFVLELFAIFMPLFNQAVVDDVLTSGDHELLSVLVAGFALILLIQSALSLARSWWVMVLSQTVSIQWLSNVFAHLLKLPANWFAQRHLGDIASRFGAVHDIQRTLTQTTLESLLDGLMAIAALVMMFIYSPTLTWVVLAASALYAIVRWISYTPFRHAASERLVLAGQEQSHFIETLRAMTPLKLFARENERRTRWQSLMVEVMNRDFQTAKLNMGFNAARTLIFGLENLCVFWLGAKIILASQAQNSGNSVLTVGMLLAFISYKMQFTGRVSALINQGIELKMLNLHRDRLADIVLTPPEQDTPQGNLPFNDLIHLPASLELRNVSFRYADTEPWLFQDLNLNIQAGEHVAITGASGCGKTSLLKILLGLMAPTHGVVLYGGVPVQQLGLSNVRRKIGVVMQEDALLTGSIADNIAFFDLAPHQPTIERCAQLAEIHQDIMRMPMAYHTLIGELGSGLSGGQKQRLLLARALYGQPTVLALDEATSHLDMRNEQAVSQTLSQLQLTRIVIAHRPETIARADRQIDFCDIKNKA